MSTDYFRACLNNTDPETNYAVLLDLMGEVRRPFKLLDGMRVFAHGDVQNTFKAVMDTSIPVSARDVDKITDAQANLAQYGIFPLIKFGIGASRDPVSLTFPR
jgi:hypothetical protein